MSDSTVLLVLLAAVGVSAVYAAILERYHEKYSPDYVWVTVVIGNGLILLFSLVFVVLGDISWRAFWRFFAINVAMGLPVISWQFGQNRARATIRKRRSNGGQHGPSSTDQGR